MITFSEILSTIFIIVGAALLLFLLTYLMRPSSAQGVRVNMGDDSSVTLRKSAEGIIISMDTPSQTEEEFFLDRRKADPSWWKKHQDAVREQRDYEKSLNPDLPINDVLTEDLWRSFILLVYQEPQERRRILDVLVSQGIIQSDMAESLLQQCAEMAPRLSPVRKVSRLVSEVDAGAKDEGVAVSPVTEEEMKAPSALDAPDSYFDGYDGFDDYAQSLDEGDWDMEENGN